MPGIQTTVIGSYPKPAFLKTPDWFKTGPHCYDPDMMNRYMNETTNADFIVAKNKAIKEVVDEQVSMGIDVITDGEIARENYVFHFCRKLKNFSFVKEELTYKTHRNGAIQAFRPTVVGKLKPLCDQRWMNVEWKKTQALTSVPVKMTIPGPMTIIDTSANSYYKTNKEFSLDLVKCINLEVRALAAVGCKHIQIDEPLFVRQPDTAMDYGLEHLKMCFEGVEDKVQKTVHLCCGYPRYLDDETYMKGDPAVYFQLAKQLDEAGFDAISIEDAHCHNDLTLLQHFKKTKIVLGVIAIAKSKIESVQEIKDRVYEALKYIKRDQLVLAPDCGLGFLPKDILQKKLENMVAAAKLL